ncbi:MAG: MlaD family protein [Bacteroidales bacterium]|jgi:phospholipid/cholesterol/gamma-HCH transport system substrate-binding protein|nr:MlaD family protein [Bacteroidales bacterium]
MRFKKELQIGLIALFAIVLLIVGLNYMKGEDIFSSDNTYYAVYNSVPGLHASNYIYINGMKSGYVKKIERLDEHGQLFLVTIAVDNDVKIPQDSKLVMYSSGILGGTELRIDPGKATVFCANNDTLEAGTDLGLLDRLSGDLKPTVNNLTSAVAQLDSVLIAINKVLDAKGQENIRQSLDNIKTTTAYLSSVSIHIDGLLDKQKIRVGNILANLESITRNFDNNSEKLNNIISNFNTIADTLAQAQIGSTLRETNQSLTSLSTIIRKIDNGEGNLGLLINDDKLYKNIDESAKKLDALIEDIKANPKRYLRFSVF